MVLVGKHDPTFNGELMAKTYRRRCPLATIEVLKNAGHYSMNETPLALAGAIECFLGDIASNTNAHVSFAP